MKSFNKDNYVGSRICVLSSQLFLVASIYKFKWGNYIECISIFLLYLSSIMYHKKPTHKNKKLDEFFVKINICTSIIISLFQYNIIPPICIIILSYMYYLNEKRIKLKINSILSNLYHAIFIHFVAFIGFMSFRLN